MANDRQTKSQTTMCPGGGAIGLAESLKDVREKSRINPRTAIAYLNLHMSTIMAQADFHFSLAGRELRGV